jgi:hypothetical protein
MKSATADKRAHPIPLRLDPETLGRLKVKIDGMDVETMAHAVRKAIKLGLDAWDAESRR